MARSSPGCDASFPRSRSSFLQPNRSKPWLRPKPRVGLIPRVFCANRKSSRPFAALARTPMAIAYNVSAPESLLRPLVKLENFALPNLILGRSSEDRAVPEFFQQDATPEALAASLAKLLRGGAEREAQLSAFDALRAEMLGAGSSPSRRAAEIVLSLAQGGETSRG